VVRFQSTIASQKQTLGTGRRKKCRLKDQITEIRLIQLKFRKRFLRCAVRQKSDAGRCGRASWHKRKAAAPVSAQVKVNFEETRVRGARTGRSPRRAAPNHGRVGIAGAAAALRLRFFSHPRR